MTSALWLNAPSSPLSARSALVEWLPPGHAVVCLARATIQTAAAAVAWSFGLSGEQIPSLLAPAPSGIRRCPGSGLPGATGSVLADRPRAAYSGAVAQPKREESGCPPMLIAVTEWTQLCVCSLIRSN
jgi:hypothetical protein